MRCIMRRNGVWIRYVFARPHLAFSLYPKRRLMSENAGERSSTRPNDRTPGGASTSSRSSTSLRHLAWSTRLARILFSTMYRSTTTYVPICIDKDTFFPPLARDQSSASAAATSPRSMLRVRYGCHHFRFQVYNHTEGPGILAE